MPGARLRDALDPVSRLKVALALGQALAIRGRDAEAVDTLERVFEKAAAASSELAADALDWLSWLAWIDLDVPQCGYCQSGMIMSVVALLNKRPHPTDTEIDAEITNACRCSTYHRIRQAIRLAASRMSAAGRDLR